MGVTGLPQHRWPAARRLADREDEAERGKEAGAVGRSCSWSHRSLGRGVSNLGVVMNVAPTAPLPLRSLRALLLGLRQAGPLTGEGCLSGRAARAGDREDGVDHDTINLII